MEQNFEMQSIRLKNETAKLKLEHKEMQEMARVEGQRDVQVGRRAVCGCFHAFIHSFIHSFVFLLPHSIRDHVLCLRHASRW